MTDGPNLAALFIQEYGDSNQQIDCFFAPGRVNLIGEYTDFNGGYVFPAALTLGIYGALRFRQDNLIQLTSANASLAVALDLNKPIDYSEQDGWVNYPKGVIKYLLDGGYALKGCDILFSGNLPDGAGLSSSAAMLVLTAFMLQHVNGDLKVDRTKLARFCQKVENEFIKVNCGIMDQFSIARGREECAILLDCKTLNYKYISFALKDYSLVIMNTNKQRELTDSKYNERRSECEQAMKIISHHRPIENLCQALLTEVETHLKDDILRRRARHVVTENRRVLTAAKLLQQGDIAGFGGLMTLSHMSLKNDFEVTGLELDAIVGYALKTAGCIGARMTGAGFGGCAIALVETGQLDDFKAAVTNAYQASTGRIPRFYVTGIADGVKCLQLPEIH